MLAPEGGPLGQWNLEKRMKDFDPGYGDSKLASYTKEDFLRLIEKGRDSLSDEQMNVLFTLYEEDHLQAASEVLATNETELGEMVDDIVRLVEPPALKRPPKSERLRGDGKPYRKRLANTALLKIISEHDDLTEDEVRILQAAADSFNQVIAADSLGMSYKEFIQAYMAIRNTHEF